MFLKLFISSCCVRSAYDRFLLLFLVSGWSSLLIKCPSLSVTKSLTSLRSPSVRLELRRIKPLRRSGNASKSSGNINYRMLSLLSRTIYSYYLVTSVGDGYTTSLQMMTSVFPHFPHRFPGLPLYHVHRFAYVLKLENQRNNLLKGLRDDLKPGALSCLYHHSSLCHSGRLFCGRNKVMQVALGVDPESECQEGEFSSLSSSPLLLLSKFDETI